MADRITRRRQAAIAVIVATLLAIGIAVTLVGLGAPRRPSDVSAVSRASSPPAVPPTLFADEAPEDARASNAAVPVARGTPPVAPPFHYPGPAADRAAAEACLTAALLYEAGDDPPGERAVAQVVLNRLRHPVFPKTVCGVVFQGSERRTGCQFTFTCDGSLARVPSPPAWTRARAIAGAALAGAVFAPVGTATHYHTDWVVPYWRSSLEKIAVVHTQIFYRWPGAWGSRAMLTGRVEGPERADPRVARLAGIQPDAVAPGADQAPVPGALAVAGVPAAALGGIILRLKDEDAGQFVIQLNPAAATASQASAAVALCGEKLECTVLGWTDARDIPASLPVTSTMMRSLAFAYRRSRSLGLAQAYWDCRRFPQARSTQCLAD